MKYRCHLYLKFKTCTAHMPVKATKCSAAYDISADRNYDNQMSTWKILPNTTTWIKTGIHVSTWNNYVVKIYIRSGLAKEGITLSTGVSIVNGNCAELIIPLFNNTKKIKIIHPGERIAQMMVEKIHNVPIEVVKEISENTERGKGGFGSTGKK